MIAALYLRVSSTDQAEPDRYGIPAQEAACRKYAADNGLIITGRYVDEISGAQATRPALEQLLEEAHQYSAVILYAQDRLARDVEVAYALLRALQKRGLAVHSTQRGKLERGLVFGIEALLGEEERERIKQRTHRGRVERAKSGLPPTGITAYGYDYGKNTSAVTLNPERAPVARRIFELAASGTPVARIVKTLNAEGVPPPGRGGRGTYWWPRTIREMLKSPTFKGEFVYGRQERILIPVPAIVSRGVWEAAQRPPRTLAPLSDALLVGHLRCGVCGYAISSSKTSGGRQYRCGRNAHPYSGTCGNRRIMTHLLEPVVERTLREMLAKPRLLEAALVVTEMSAEDADALRALDLEDERWLLAFQAQAITAQELAEYRRGVTERRDGIRKRQARQYDFRAVARALKGASLREILRALNVTIVFDQGEIDIRIAP